MEMKIKLIFGSLLVIIFLITGCTAPTDSDNFVCNKPYIQIGQECCLDNDDNAICDKDEMVQSTSTNQTINEAENIQETVVNEENQTVNAESNALPNRAFSIDELSAFITKISGAPKLYIDNSSDKYIKTYPDILKEKNHVLYTNNNQYKIWTVEIINNPNDRLETMNDFYNYVRAENWDGWKYYVNLTTWRWLIPPVTEKELKEIIPRYDYKTQYKTYVYSTWVDHDVLEKVINDLNQPVLQYRLETIIFTPEEENGYAIGNWEALKLIYKIPCTKDIIVYYNPKWDSYDDASIWNQNKDEILKFWERSINQKMPTSLKYAHEIMNFCGITNTSFSNTFFQDYEKHERLVHNWKIYFAKIFNYSFDAEVVVKPTSPDNKSYEIDHINMSFVSHDVEEDMKSLRVKIEIETAGNTYDYGDIKLYSGNTYPDTEKNMTISLTHNEFGKNTTIVFKPYYGYIGYTDIPEEYKYYLGGIPLRKQVT